MTSAPAAPVPSSVPLPGSLAGVTVLIVGGSSGIGLAAAGLLASVGARPVLAGRDEARLKAAAESLAERCAAGGTDVRTYPADVRDEERLAEVLDELGTVGHVLVTAGTVTRAPLAEAGRELVADSVEGRLWGGYAVARAAAPRLAPGGSITYLSGIYVARPVPGGAAVIAAAAATEGLAKALAVELAPRRIRVNAVRSGTVDTPMLRRRLPDDEAVAAAGRAMPLGRYGTAEEAASAALFLMSNPYVTGSVLTIDGGQSLF
ncbi:SDR family oxidoreductase [Streptomyces sp. NPDC089919]|uniref:SDR family NAD(P)-dependent oxidoreductase n=1 Tax=Streptomyces sp. NPDC089919 TaxID=3155188 RepID=UPI003433A8A8